MEASIEKDSNLNQDTMAGKENYSKYFEWIMYSTEFTVDVRIIRTSLALTQHTNYNYFTFLPMIYFVKFYLLSTILDVFSIV